MSLFNLKPRLSPIFNLLKNLFAGWVVRERMWGQGGGGGSHPLHHFTALINLRPGTIDFRPNNTSTMLGKSKSPNTTTALFVLFLILYKLIKVS